MQFAPRFCTSVFFRASAGPDSPIVPASPNLDSENKMNKLLTYGAALSLIALGVSALHASPPESEKKADYTPTRENRPATAFSRIEIEGPYKVLIDAQGAPAIEVSGPKRQVEQLETVIQGDTLHVRPLRRNHWVFGFGRQHDPVIVKINATGLKALSNGGSGDVELEHVDSGELKLISTGPGDMSVSGSATELTVKSSGSGDMHLHRMRATNVNLVMTGPGEVSAPSITGDLNAVLSGSGDLEAGDVRANKINAYLNGPGSVELRGSSKDIRVEISGSGDLEACSMQVENVSAMLNGPGSACLNGTIKKFDAEVHGSGDLEARGLQTQNTRVNLSGPGSMNLSGSSDTLSADVSGSGDLDAKGLKVAKAITRSRGPGNVFLSKVSDSLDAEVSGSGDLHAEPQCKDVKVSMSGPGGVELRGWTGTLNANVSGPGNLDARDMLAKQAEVNVRGAGNATINVQGKVAAQGQQLDSDKQRVVTVDRRGAHTE